MMVQWRAGLVLLLVSVSANDVERWGQWEMTWMAETNAMNPFVDVEFFVELTPPASSASAVTVRGFYDGNGLFKARFMPPTIGEWKYYTKCNIEQLDGKHGTFTAHAPKVNMGLGANHGTGGLAKW